MDVSLDYKDLFKKLNKHKVKYLIIGAYAVGYYTEPRFTKDLDVWVKPDSKNADRLYRALKEFGAPLKDISSKDFTNKKLIYQIGIAPVRIDIFMSLYKMGFDASWKNKINTKYDGASIHILGKKDLIRAKKKSKRLQDKLDLKKLLK